MRRAHRRSARLRGADDAATEIIGLHVDLRQLPIATEPIDLEIFGEDPGLVLTRLRLRFRLRLRLRLRLHCGSGLDGGDRRGTTGLRNGRRARPVSISIGAGFPCCSNFGAPAHWTGRFTAHLSHPPLLRQACVYRTAAPFHLAHSRRVLQPSPRHRVDEDLHSLSARSHSHIESALQRWCQWCPPPLHGVHLPNTTALGAGSNGSIVGAGCLLPYLDLCHDPGVLSARGCGCRKRR
mmetsp:Transcript_97696/g.218048  ORF Transcript_97696/g.218048 Transcript_97696/m.218048 type:complete len:237 (-) Transcript_97696:274-984(-)